MNNLVLLLHSHSLKVKFEFWQFETELLSESPGFLRVLNLSTTDTKARHPIKVGSLIIQWFQINAQLTYVHD